MFKPSTLDIGVYLANPHRHTGRGIILGTVKRAIFWTGLIPDRALFKGNGLDLSLCLGKLVHI